MSTNKFAPTRLAPLYVFLVSVYLLAAGAWLILTKRIPRLGFRRLVRASMRASYAGPLGEARPERGLAWIAEVPSYLLSDHESVSSLQLFEDDRPIGPAHAPHDEIRDLGGGRFSHWGGAVFFSTPDGSDPRSNGRRYTVREVRP